MSKSAKSLAMRPIAIATLTLGFALVGNSPTLATTLLSTGFESPDYSVGDLIGQQSWTKPFAGTPLTTVAVPGVGDPAAPEGSQYARITRATQDARAAKEFSNPALTDPFSIDVLLAYGNLSTNSLAAVYVSNAAASFNGVTFGFKEISGQVNIVYRDNSTDIPIAPAAANTFYRFFAEVDPATATYDILVEQMNGDPVGSAQGAHSRNGVDTFTHFTLNVLTAAGTLYADQIGITVVPEPSAFILMGGAVGMLGLAYRRRRRTVV